MRNLIALSAVGSLVLCLFSAGCGGDDESAGAEQIDKATFVKEANQICEQASGRLAADIAAISKRESEKPGSNFNKGQIALVEEGLLPRLEEELRQIRELGMPEEAKKEVTKLLKAYGKAIEQTKKKARTVALTENAAPHEAIAVVATSFGITECPISPVQGN